MKGRGHGERAFGWGGGETGTGGERVRPQKAGEGRGAGRWGTGEGCRGNSEGRGQIEVGGDTRKRVELEARGRVL